MMAGRGRQAMRTSVWIAVVCRATRRVLVAKRARTARNGGQWNFFGGGLDRHERPEQTARRELREEAGIHTALSTLVPLAEATTGGKRNLLFGLVVAGEIKPRLNDESEESRWISLADLTRHHLLHPPTQRLLPAVAAWLESLTAAVETEAVAEVPEPAAAMPAPAEAPSWWGRAAAALAALRRRLAGHDAA
jgi:8-oxo-dGTP diphosphatase